MSETTSTTTAPETPPTPTSTGPSAEENAALRNALAKVQQDYAALQGQLSGVIRERDTFKDQTAKLEPKAKLADELQIKVDGFVNTGRETAIVEALRGKLIGAEPLALRGVLAQLNEQGKANRYAEDSAAEAAKILKIIETEAPSLTRPPISASGSSLVRPAAKAGYRGPFTK